MAGEAKATDQITSPVVWRRWLSAELVRLRNRAKLTQRDGAHALRCSVGKLSYLESGDRAPNEDELEILLRLYKLPKERWQQYLDAADAANGPAWWDAWADEDLPKDLLRYVGLEDGAHRIRAYSPLIVHGLVQTPDYAAAIIEGDLAQTAPERIDRIAHLRTARQAVLTRDSNPLDAHIVLDEAAIRRRVGGRLMLKAQLAHLAELAHDMEHLTIQVVPFEAGAHGALYGAFSILSFPWPGDSGVVYVENLVESTLLEARSDIYEYSEAFARVVDVALDPERSLAFIQSTIQELT